MLINNTLVDVKKQTQYRHNCLKIHIAEVSKWFVFYLEGTNHYKSYHKNPNQHSGSLFYVTIISQL